MDVLCVYFAFSPPQNVCARSTQTLNFFHSVRLHLVVGRVAEYPLWLVNISNAIFGETKTVSVYCRRSTKGRLLFVLNNYY